MYLRKIKMKYFLKLLFRKLLKPLKLNGNTSVQKMFCILYKNNLEFSIICYLRKIRKLEPFLNNLASAWGLPKNLELQGHTLIISVNFYTIFLILLPDTEVSKNITQQFISSHFTSNLSKMVQGFSDVNCHQVGRKCRFQAPFHLLYCLQSMM